MTDLFLQIAEALRANVPQASWIDLDRGQTNAIIQDGNITFDLPAIPAIFVGLPDETWEQLTNHSQIGTGQLMVTLLMHLPSAVSATDPLLSLSVEALSLSTDVHEAILTVPNVMHRTRTKRFPVAHLFAVCEFYEVGLNYLRVLKTTPKPAPKITVKLSLPATLNQQ